MVEGSGRRRQEWGAFRQYHQPLRSRIRNRKTNPKTEFENADTWGASKFGSSKSGFDTPLQSWKSVVRVTFMGHEDVPAKLADFFRPFLVRPHLLSMGT